MRYFLHFCRIIVGATFIVSGLVKANDPLGFSYKLEEYFEPSALNLPGLVPYALALAILACLAEVVLGFAVLVGGRMKLATWAILLLTVFFGWLTSYTATCDPQGKYEVIENGVKVMKDVTCVTDCGCFGDAMKGSLGRSLTPWESFYKDLVLLVLVLPIFFFSVFRKPGIGFNTASDDRVLLPGALIVVALWCWVFGWSFFLWFAILGLLGYLLIKRFFLGGSTGSTARAEWITAAWVTIIAFGFILYCWQHLPLKDYRAYGIGKNISEEQRMGKPPVQNIFLVYKNKVTGEQKEFDSKGKYPWDDSTWVYVDRRIDIIERGIDSPVKDFLLTDRDGVDITADVLGETAPILLIVAKNIDKAATKCQPAINALADAATKAGWYVYGVTSSSYEEVEAFRHEHQNPFDYVTCDEITLKTMIRSNPGVVLLQQGAVRGQWHCNDVPTLEQAKALLK